MTSLSPARVVVQINIEQYVDNVFRFALSLTRDRHLAEDLTQECFLKAYQRKRQLRSQSAAKSWLFQILINLWKDHLKTNRDHASGSMELELLADYSRPDDKSVQRENYNWIVGQMQLLPDQQRTVLFLSAVEQLSNLMIAELVGSTMNSVKANLSIARKTMRQKLMQQARGEQTQVERTK